MTCRVRGRGRSSSAARRTSRSAMGRVWSGRRDWKAQNPSLKVGMARCTVPARVQRAERARTQGSSVPRLNGAGTPQRGVPTTLTSYTGGLVNRSVHPLGIPVIIARLALAEGGLDIPFDRVAFQFPFELGVGPEITPAAIHFEGHLAVFERAVLDLAGPR